MAHLSLKHYTYLLKQFCIDQEYLQPLCIERVLNFYFIHHLSITHKLIAVNGQFRVTIAHKTVKEHFGSVHPGTFCLFSSFLLLFVGLRGVQVPGTPHTLQPQVKPPDETCLACGLWPELT